MYKKENSTTFNNVWLAISNDGVNFKDYGCVIEDFENPIWAMKVYKVKDYFMLNSGSFDENQRQIVLKFWRSENSTDWEYMPDLDVVSPIIEGENMRLDCMYVIN